MANSFINFKIEVATNFLINLNNFIFLQQFFLIKLFITIIVKIIMKNLIANCCYFLKMLDAKLECSQLEVLRSIQFA